MAEKRVAVGGTTYFKFPTQTLAGVKATLSGTPAISAYKNGSTTQSTAGITLTVDYDGVTGLNHVTIDTSADGTFYADGSVIELVITAGTVDSISVIGEVVGAIIVGKQDVNVESVDADAITAASLAADAVAEIQSGLATSTVLTTALTEAYRSTGATGSVAQLLYEIIAHLGEFAIVDVTKTTKKLDGSTTAKTYTINDNEHPTSITETT